MRSRYSAVVGVGLAVASLGCTGRTNELIDDVAVSTASNGIGAPERAQRFEYGEHGDAFADLWLPDVDDASLSGIPVVVLIHGGFWRDGFFLDLMEPLIPSLLDAGFAVWNIEYRRIGAGGGYPQTFIDASAAIDKLADLPQRFAGVLNLADVAAVGHSAGGHLAVWLASRGVLPPGMPGADPLVMPRIVVSQAGVLDLIGCIEQGVGGTACSDLVGSMPGDEPTRFVQTSPTEMLPIAAEVIAVHGSSDRIVPLSQSETYVERSVEAGGQARLDVIDGADHFSHLDPGHPAWLAVIDALTT